MIKERNVRKRAPDHVNNLHIIRFDLRIDSVPWNTVCLELPLEVLRAAANSSITELLVKNQHVPELGVASAVQERLAELMNEPPNVSDRRSMASEAKRRETFTHWPHMDYKWALPDQMAQAGFYHQPNSSGDDRAMCFTCTVCLVCWERTDEPWSEHERHSPNCPFVMGEYTQNVPLSTTYATNPAIDATYRGVGINTLGASSVPHLLPTANKDGLISVFDITGKVSRPHSFFVTHFDSYILEKFTQDFGVPAMWTDIDDVKDPTEKRIMSLAIVGDKISCNKSTHLSGPRPTIVCSLKIRCRHSNKSKTKASIETLNDQNKNNLSSMNIMDIDEIPDNTRKSSCLYLVVYDFLYKKELIDKDNETLKENTSNINSNNVKETPEVFKTLVFPYGLAGECVIDESNDLNYMKPLSEYIIKQQTNNYQTLIPGESDEIFLPPTITPKHSGPRALPVEMQTETDSAQATSIIIPPDYSFMNGPLSMSNVVADKSISDHIIGLKNSKTAKKLNYSRAVQCVCLPEQYKTRTDMEVTDILPTQDGSHVLVVLNSTYESSGSILFLYALNLNDSMVKLVEEPVLVRELNPNEKPVEINLHSMVKLVEEPVLVRELNPNEKPVEINLLTQLERTLENTVKSSGVEGTVILVCADGVVRILELATLKTLSIARLENEKFVSAAYCNSLERLCASTEKGSLHFYALNDTDSDSTEDHDEEDFFSLNSDMPSVSAQPLDSIDVSDTTRCFYEPPEIISLTELKRLYSLCHFEAFKPGFCAVVPPCWSDMQQAQRQRRHPQHLQLDTEQFTKTWRLQNDTTTWDEHIFEITLPSPVCIGHVDVHFTLQPGSTNPGIEVTLLRQNTNSIGHRRDVRFAVDDAVTFDALRNCDNPVTSQEYLRSHNADILAGPVDIASCLDLSDQSGCVTLTSPKLFKSRNRTLLLHIKAVSNFSRDELKSSVSSKNKGRTDIDKNSGGTRKTEYMGCDCMHELSVTVYSSRHTEIPHERTQRSTMLESNVFVQSLLLTAVKCSAEEPQGIALDILNWIASIRLTRNRSQMGESPAQQLELLKIVENNLDNLLRECLLLAGRSIAHKCVKLIATCSNGGKNINDTVSSQFDSRVFNALVTILDTIQQIKSAGSLQWLIILIYKVAQESHSIILASKCIDLLTKISDELTKRTNPYHLLLRSRFGLYGTPLEPELFDMDVPPTAKASSSSITYASVVSGETITQTECPTTYIHKENLDPRDILTTTSGELKIKLKNLSPSKVFRGLLETEPLHFTCISASDGTRLERADAGNNSIVNNICPITVYSNSGTKKVDFEHLFGDLAEVGVYKQGEEKTSNGQGSSNSSNSYDYAYTYPMLISQDSSKKEEFDKLWTLTPSIDQDIPNPQMKTKRTEEILSPNKTLPWQQLLVAPPQQVIIVERMHSGARRFVTLDFGQPVLLTDIMIPASHDLVSISIDLWLKNEEADGLRLVVSSDIGSRDLILSDLQPPPLCRYMKITTVGRYGMSTTRCRIPIGNFYGHLIVLPEEISPDQVQNVNKLSQADLEGQLNILALLLEDVSCRYSLACSKLKDLLHPFLMSDSSNAAHLSAYMETIRDRSNGSIGTMENMKIVNVYQEAVTYQRQINIVRIVMSRIENSLNKASQEVKVNSLAEACTDKLRIISEGLLEVLLSIDTPSDISLEVCQKLFQGFCISQRSRVQILAATLLDRSCRRQPYWGNFLADTLATMFSSSYTENFPQDRVFVLLAYLVRKSIDRSAVLDATLRVVSQALLPITQSQKTLLAVTVDLPLLGWLLLFLSLQLDLCKGSQQNSNRWDWVTGEMAGKNSSDNLSSNYRKKLHKRFIQYKQQLDNLDFTHKVVQTSAQALSAISNHAANLTSKLEAALKHQENFFKKIKQYKIKEGKSELETKPGNKRRKDPTESNSVKGPHIFPHRIDSGHCLAVSKGLLTLLLAIDHSCSADMFLLSCKVIARLVRMSGLTLGNLMSEEQLGRLINLCIGSELPWAPHALACLLQDIVNVVDVTFTPNTESDMETDPSPASTSWATEILSDVESLCESFEIEDHLMTEQIKPNNKPTSINNHSTPLPSVYESDDSEFEDFLDDILERGRSLLKKPSKTLHSVYSDSCAMDSRLEATVELQAEVTLRRLILLSSHSLIQNINAPVVPIDVECELNVWPSELLIPWQIQTHSNTRNRNMLINCFDNLFRTLQMQSSTNIEHILQLWLTLSLNSDEKFNPNSIPFIALSPEAVNCLITAITWSPGLSLRAWCSALQTLTLICNIMHGMNGANSEWSETFGLYCRTGYIVNHSDFVQMLLRLLSGTGLVFSDKGLAGPSLCRALHDFIVRLHMRCDVVSPNSQAGSLLKSLLLKIVYQLVQPSGPLNARQGPLDAQCKLLQTMVYLDYANADLSIAISILECTGILVHSFVSNSDRIKCVNIGERLSQTSHSFSGIFASVLGGETSKQDRPVSWDILLISLLKLLVKLVQTPLPNIGNQTEAMETESAISSQTDESKAEQIHQDSLRNNPPAPCLADTVLQHHPSIIRLCQALAACKASSLSMLANMSQQSTIADLGEPTTVGDAVFNLLAALARKASQKSYVMEPLLIFLSQTPQLSEPLLWFILQVLDTEESLRSFVAAGGIGILGQSLVRSSNAPNTVSHASTVSMVMQHFVGFNARSDANTAIAASSSTKKLQQACLENNLSLVNFAPYGSIRCQSGTAHPADVLIQGGTATHRRARTPQWSYHFYPEEAHTELTLQLPSAVLLREVHLQPHLSALATCPSAVALEVSADGPSRLVPACPPLPTSGMTFIRLHLPVPEVVNCIQLRLYKPRDANNIGLSQIRLLGTSAFGGNVKQQILDLSEDESHCKYSLGWLRLLHHCFTLSNDEELGKHVVASAAQVQNLIASLFHAFER
ncbi:Inhibitor of Apoptosis domain [Popillia japonica]|uniref:Inhibitor of Apoptosis domain n=2 Tax=Popillia japonica TaxID=7064 RepID=A0AAW1L1V3_POPJA